MAKGEVWRPPGHVNDSAEIMLAAPALVVAFGQLHACGGVGQLLHHVVGCSAAARHKALAQPERCDRSIVPDVVREHFSERKKRIIGQTVT